jgi:hypothetical protein
MMKKSIVTAFIGLSAIGQVTATAPSVEELATANQLKIPSLAEVKQLEEKYQKAEQDLKDCKIPAVNQEPVPLGKLELNALAIDAYFKFVDARASGLQGGTIKEAEVPVNSKLVNPFRIVILDAALSDYKYHNPAVKKLHEPGTVNRMDPRQVSILYIESVLADLRKTHPEMFEEK